MLSAKATVRRRKQANEVGTISARNHTLAILEVVLPMRRVDNLLHAEVTLGRTHIAYLDLVAEVLAAGDGIAFNDLIISIV